MFASQQFRAKAAEYTELAKGTEELSAVSEFQRLERSYTDLANNDDWLANNSDKTIQPMSKDIGCDDPSLTDEEANILRCLGAAVVVRWNTIPTKLQRELFDNAGSVGERLQANELKAQIACFLHRHKDDWEPSLATGPYELGDVTNRAI